MRMLDLFSGRWVWSRAFAAKGWECVGIDLMPPPETPEGCFFIQADVLKLGWLPAEGLVYCREDGTIFTLGYFDFICASSPCEQFSIHGMKHFHPNPAYPEMGLTLFNHTRALCEASGLPYVMENVRSAQKFVGNAVNHCGPFYLWGNAVPPLIPQGITKGIDVGSSKAVKGMTLIQKREYRKQFPWNQAWSTSAQRGICWRPQS